MNEMSGDRDEKYRSGSAHTQRRRSLDFLAFLTQARLSACVISCGPGLLLPRGVYPGVLTLHQRVGSEDCLLCSPSRLDTRTVPDGA